MSRRWADQHGVNTVLTRGRATRAVIMQAWPLGTPARDRSAVVTVAAAVGVIVLALLAARADARAVGGSPPLTVLDLAVGFAFVLASIPATGALHERLLVGAVGIAWFAGSVFTFARSLHQGVLAVALLAFPAGRLAGVPRQLHSIGSVAVAFGVVPNRA
jgi:hypothetical protein